MKMSSIFSKEEQQFIKDNYKGKSSLNLTNMLNEKFDKNYTMKQIQQFKKARRLRSGVNTQFKKQQIPHNLKQEGDEFVEKRGYKRIKYNGKWEMKHRYIYEKAYGKLPNDWDVVLLDGNLNNLDLSNLMAVPRRDKLVCMRKHLSSTNREVTKVGLLTAQLSNKLYDLEKKDER